MSSTISVRSRGERPGRSCPSFRYSRYGEIDLVAVLVALGDRRRAIDLLHFRIRNERSVIGRPAASCPQDALRRAPLSQFVATQPFRTSGRRRASSVGPNSLEPASLDARQRTNRLDHRHPAAEADAPNRVSGVRGRSAPARILPSRNRRWPKPPGEDAVECLQGREPVFVVRRPPLSISFEIGP